MRWECLCVSKGRIRFKDLKDFSIALLAKWGWHILSMPNCLMARLLKSIYFKNCSFLELETRGSPGTIWKRISLEKNVITQGARMWNRNGFNFKVWNNA